MKRIGIIFAIISITAFGGEPVDALKSVRAPNEEYVRMPLKYILQKLEQTAGRSGNAALSGFRIRNTLPDIADKRITVNCEGLTLYQALDAVAASAGAGITYSGKEAVFKDPSSIQDPGPVATEKPVKPSANKEDRPITFSDVDSALIFIESSMGRGSGFIAEMKGTPYLLSNQHNFLGAAKIRLRAMHGGVLEPTSFEFSKSRDLVRFKLKPKDLKKLSVLQLAEGNPQINQPIMVYGNSAGGGVATELKGKVMGVGPSEIEIDADIVPGNSGSPVLDTSGQVLGVATYITFARQFSKGDVLKEVFKGTRFGKARRYGVRIPEKDWVEIPMQNFLNQTYRLVDMQNYIEAMYILIQYWNGNKNFAPQAQHIISAYSASGKNVETPYSFNFPETEKELIMSIKSFSRNYQEFADEVNDMELTKNELNKLDRNFGKKSTNNLESLDYRIRTTMLNKATRLKEKLNKYEFASSFLETSAEPLHQTLSEIIRILDTNKNPYKRLKR